MEKTSQRGWIVNEDVVVSPEVRCWASWKLLGPHVTLAASGRHCVIHALSPYCLSYRRHCACTSDILEDNQRNLYSAEALCWDLPYAIQD